MLLAVVAAGGLRWWHGVEARRAWAAALPGKPRMEKLPEEFRRRVEADRARLAGWPPDVAALRELTELYLANGFQAEAEQGLRALLIHDPGNARWPHHLASLLAGYGQLEEALVLWRRVGEREPAYLPARLKLAEALLKTNRLDEARKAYEAILAEKPGEPYALLGSAQVAVQDGAWGRARDFLESAVAANAGFSAGYSLLATVYERLGDTASAAQARKKAQMLGRFKDSPDPWADELTAQCYDVYRLQVLAATLNSTGSAAEAVRLLGRALEVAPEDASAHRQLGKIYIGLHEFGKARTELETAIRLQPADPAAYLDLVNVFRVTNDKTAAFALIESGLKNVPAKEAAGLNFEMALALVADARREEAIPYLTRATELDPDNTAAAQYLEQLYAKMGRTPSRR